VCVCVVCVCVCATHRGQGESEKVIQGGQRDKKQQREREIVWMCAQTLTVMLLLLMKWLLRLNWLLLLLVIMRSGCKTSNMQ
jgi:hypothetical protein